MPDRIVTLIEHIYTHANYLAVTPSEDAAALDQNH
jgi:hypothetical protein